jgi:DNA repair exonuclease SbcCD ATPase subunit
LGKIQDASNLVNNFNIPGIPKIDNPLKALEGKLPSKELADKAAAKYKELQDKLNNLKKTKVNIKKPKLFKPKEVPVPKKFKKAELEKLKGLTTQAQGLASQAQGLASQAQGLASQAQGLAQNALSQAQGLASQAKGLASQAQGALSQVQSLQTTVLSQAQNIASKGQSAVAQIAKEINK